MNKQDLIATLPAPSDRYTPLRKARILDAINGGAITTAEACERYNITAEELAGWQRRDARHGVQGLRVTRSQHYDRFVTEHC